MRASEFIRLNENQDMMSKAEANYRMASGNQRCGGCTMFRAPHSCTLVEGNISEDGVCDHYEASAQVNESAGEQFCEECGGTLEWSLNEHGKASRALCKSSRSNDDLGVSQLASCKSQGLRARETSKKHTIGNKRVKIKGKSVKGHKYGGPLPYNKSDN